MKDSAVRADSVKTGVTLDERFETISAEIHFGVRGASQESDNARHFQDMLESGAADWLIPYLKRDPDTAQIQPAQIRSLAVIRHMEIRGGAHSRVREFLELGNDLQTAIMKGEAAVVVADDVGERVADGGAGQLERKPKDDYLGSSVTDLMDANKRTTGHGSSRRKNKAAALKAIVGTCENCERPLYSGIVVCQECGYVVAERRGRKLKGDEPRVRTTISIDRKTREAFGKNKEVLSAWMDICGKLVASGCKIKELDLFAERKSVDAA